MVAGSSSVTIRRRRTHQVQDARPSSSEVVAGDNVRLQRETGATDSAFWVVAERLPRRNVLKRTDSRGWIESIAANLDQLGIVMAPRPTCDPFIVDRYLAGAGFAGIDPLLIVNKQDLIGDGEHSADESGIRRRLPADRYSGRHGLRPSADTGLDALMERSAGPPHAPGRSVRGRQVVPDQRALRRRAYRATSELSVGSGPGQAHDRVLRHRAAALGRAGRLPGRARLRPARRAAVRTSSRATSRSCQQARGCRFQDCLHLREPQCAVQAAVAAGQIDARRLRKLPAARQPDPPARRKTGLVAAADRSRQLHFRPGWYDVACNGRRASRSAWLLIACAGQVPA